VSKFESTRETIDFPAASDGAHAIASDVDCNVQSRHEFWIAGAFARQPKSLWLTRVDTPFLGALL
jgi:hypothetical protein